MSRSEIVLGIIVGALVFWLIGFVQHLDDEVDVRYGYNERNRVEMTSLEAGFNSMPLVQQKSSWNNSQLKTSMLSLFPKFIEMKDFVSETIEEENTFKSQLLAHIEGVEEKYIAGELTQEQAMNILESF